MHKRSLFIIFLIVFIDLVGFGLVIPILPYYAQSFGASAWKLGWLMASYSLMQFLFAPVWGKLSDYIGRRPVLLISLLGSSISMAILGIATTLSWLFLGRIFAGLCGANISTAYAYITDITTPKERASGMGMIGAAFGLGFIFGPAMGGLLSRYGYSTPMFVGSGLALLNCLFAFFQLKEPHLTPVARAAHRSKRFDLKTIRNAFEDPRSKLAILLFFLLTFAVAQMESLFAIYMGAQYGYTADKAGILLALMGVIMALVQGGLIGRLAHKYGEKKLITLGISLCCFSLLAFASTSILAIVVVSLMALAFGHGIVHPSLSSLASMGASPQRRGATMGVFQSAGSLARVFGPPCAGWLYDWVNSRSPFLSGAAILALAGAISYLYRLDLSSLPQHHEMASFEGEA